MKENLQFLIFKYIFFLNLFWNGFIERFAIRIHGRWKRKDFRTAIIYLLPGGV